MSIDIFNTIQKPSYVADMAAVPGEDTVDQDGLKDKISKSFFTLFFVMGFSGFAQAQNEFRPLNPCQKALVLPVSGKTLAPEIFENINEAMTAGEIIDVLGSPARDVGSGLYVFKWDISDGRVFTISFSDMCSKPINLGFR